MNKLINTNTSNMVLKSPFSLRFDSTGIETRFWRDIVHRSMKLIRFSLLLGISLYGLFGALDLWMVPEAAGDILIIRIIVCSFFFSGYLFTYNRLFRRYMQPVFSLLAIVAGLGVILMIAIIDEQGGYHYYAGLILVFFWVHALMRLRFVYASMSVWGMLIAYVLVAAFLKSTPAHILINNSFFLVSANIIGMISSYSIELYLKSMFWQRMVLEEKRRLLDSENDRKSKDLDEARQLQLSMLPKEVPYHPDVELAFSMNTASEVGGDYYDFVVNEDGTLTLAIGDASGHGARAGAIVAAAKILFTCMASEKGLEMILDKAAEALKSVSDSVYFMAMGLCRLRGNKLEFAGAGMPPALVYRASTGRTEEVSLSGLPLGSPVRLPFTMSEIALSPGDTVMLMSDGFPETFNPDGEMFGYDRAVEIFSEVGGLGPSEIVNRMNTAAGEWLRGSKRQDDITFVVMKVKG